MKNRNKIIFGFSIAAIAGVYATVTLSEEVITKLHNEKTRHKTKKIINNQFDRNDQLLTVMDSLTDKELNSIDTIATLIKNSKVKLEDLKKSS